ncbi:transposase, partial [Bifidobacterium longum]|uniref:transposase n=1 Tax=Bifidobacterium longum TaxID=216816 RepID=UPI001E5A57C7
RLFSYPLRGNRCENPYKTRVFAETCASIIGNILLGIGGDIANFKSAAHLAAYAGIAPVTGQSGTGIKGERPSGRGNKRLKNALWQSSFVASTKHPPSIAYYQRKREQGKHHNAAVIRLARRRCDVIYSMLKNGVLYQEPALVA